MTPAEAAAAATDRRVAATDVTARDATLYVACPTCDRAIPQLTYEGPICDRCDGVGFVPVVRSVHGQADLQDMISDALEDAENLGVDKHMKWGDPHTARHARESAAKLRTVLLEQTLVGADPLADLVSRFSVALLDKLRASEAKYGHGDAWARSDWRESLCRQLAEHIAKGDPRDVAAYAAFAWHHGWSIAPAAPTPRVAPEGAPEADDREDRSEPTTPEAILATAAREAEALAVILHRKHFPEVTQWRPLSGDVRGLLSQIDNMTSGLAKADAAPAAPGAGVDLAGARALVRSLKSSEILGRHRWFDQDVRKVEAFVRPRLDAAITALGRDAAGRGGGAGVPGELRRLSDAATQGEYHHVNPFLTVPAVRTIHGPVPAERVDYVSTWPGLGTPPGHRVVIARDGSGIAPRSADMAWLAAASNFVRARIAAEDRDRGADGREGE